MPNPFPNLTVTREEEDEEEHLPIVARPESGLVSTLINRGRELSPRQIERLNLFMDTADLGMGVSAAPLICRDTCPHAEVCPLHAEGLCEIGESCPLEGSLMLKWKDYWARSIGISLDPEEEDAFDLKLLDDLALLSVLKRRAMIEMSNTNPEVAETFTAGYINNDPIEKIQMNPRILLVERLTKLEIKLMNELLATRRDKFSVSGRVDDISKKHAQLAERIREANKKKEEEIIDVDYEVKE